MKYVVLSTFGMHVLLRNNIYVYRNILQIIHSYEIYVFETCKYL